MTNRAGSKNTDSRSSCLRLTGEVCLVALAVIAFYWIHLDSSRMQTGGDFANLFWPLKEYRLQVLREAGVLPLWNPHVFMGSPLAATMQHAVFYPIDYLFFWKSPALAAMNLYVLFHGVLAGAGAWWWMRKALRCGAAGTVLAGIAWPCTAWFQGAQEHINQVAATAWMPWMLGTLLLFLLGRMTWLRFVAAYSALGALQFLAGHPQAAFYTHLAAFFLLCVCAVRGLLRKDDPDRIKHAASTVAAFICAGLLTGLLCAVQLLPAMELSGLSYRQFQHADPAYSMTYSMPPDVLTTLFSPHRFGSYVDGFVDQRAYNEYGVFVGIPLMLLAAGGAAFLWWRKRRMAAVLGVSGIAVTLLMALGGNASVSRIARGDFTEFPTAAFGSKTVMEDVHAEGGSESGGLASLSVHEVFIRLVPPAAGFRVPARIIIVTSLLWATLASFGLSGMTDLARDRGLQRPSLYVVNAVVLCAVWTSLYLPAGVEKFRHPKDTAPLMLEWEQDRDLRDAASLDGRLFRLTTNDLNLIVAERQLSAEAEWELKLEGNGPSQRWLRWQENNNVVVGLPAIEGYEEGLSPTVRTKDFLFTINRNLRSFEPDGLLLALLGAGRMFTDLPVNDDLFPVNRKQSRGIRLIRDIPRHRGAAFWAEQARGIDFGLLEGPYYRGGSPHGRRQDRPTEYGSAPQWDEEWPTLSTDVTNPNAVILSTRGSVPGDAVLAMGQAPGWMANGEPLKWLGAVHARVPSEAFRDGMAMLEYKPASFRVGLYLTLLGVALWWCLFLAGGRCQCLSRSCES